MNPNGQERGGEPPDWRCQHSQPDGAAAGVGAGPCGALLISWPLRAGQWRAWPKRPLKAGQPELAGDRGGGDSPGWSAAGALLLAGCRCRYGESGSRTACAAGFYLPILINRLVIKNTWGFALISPLLWGGWDQRSRGPFPTPPFPCCPPTFYNSVVFLVAVTDKFTESMYVLANEPSVALYRLQEHVRRSLPELAQHKVSRASLRTPELRHSRAQAVLLTWRIVPMSPPFRGGKEGGEIGHQGARCCGALARSELG